MKARHPQREQGGCKSPFASAATGASGTRTTHQFRVRPGDSFRRETPDGTAPPASGAHEDKARLETFPRVPLTVWSNGRRGGRCHLDPVQRGQDVRDADSSRIVLDEDGTGETIRVDEPNAG